MIRYKHSQFGWVIVLGLLLVGVMATLTAVGQQSDPIEGFRIRLGMSLLILPCMLLFYCLRTTVTDKDVTVVFGIGMVRKTILLDDIEQCEPKKKQFVLGWGLRYRWDYTLWNVSGLDSVELTFKNKNRKFRIGTDQPDELCEAINKAIVERSLLKSGGLL